MGARLKKKRISFLLPLLRAPLPAPAPYMQFFFSFFSSRSAPLAFAGSAPFVAVSRCRSSVRRLVSLVSSLRVRCRSLSPFLVFASADAAPIAQRPSATATSQFQFQLGKTCGSPWVLLPLKFCLKVWVVFVLGN